MNDKAEALWQGTFLGERHADGLTIQLYSVKAFYAEIFYEVKKNKIIDIQAFTSRQQLGPYLAQIKFI
ncbi:hypothetical protein [Mucilaginibacter terrenus]|nr:hypothetical protein [Mucilaginibacter terrenus]